MDRPLVLAVDDSPTVLATVRQAVEAEGYGLLVSETAREALDLASIHDPDVVLLDVTLPDASGIDVCRELRRTSSAFVIMVSARVDETDRIIGLAAGADDYVTKPFSPRELVLRINAMLRRTRQPAGIHDDTAGGSTPITIGRLTIDPDAHEAALDGTPLELTRTEFVIIQMLMTHPRIVLTREQLMQAIQGDNWYGDTHLVHVHVSRLRAKLGDPARNPRFIRSVRGVGYRLGPCE